MGQSQQVNESGDEYEEDAATSWTNELEQQESRTPADSPEFLDFVDSEDPLEDFERNPLQKEPSIWQLNLFPTSIRRQRRITGGFTDSWVSISRKRQKAILYSIMHSS